MLQAMERSGFSIPNSCRSGVCQSCLMRSASSVLPAASQVGLRPALKELGYFLSCICKPETDLEITNAGDEICSRTQATLISRLSLNRDVYQLTCQAETPFEFHPGQFVHITRPEDGLFRSYSIASLPTQDGKHRFHGRLLPGGQLSQWLCQSISVGDKVTISGPFGSCFYTEEARDNNMLLIGTGTGLAPLYGILLDALAKGHKGDIHLYHGSYSAVGLYMIDDLRALAEKKSIFHYVPCVDAGDNSRFAIGRAADIALQQHSNLKGSRVFICGHPRMVKSTKRRAFLAGASLQHILADPFVVAASSV